MVDGGDEVQAPTVASAVRTNGAKRYSIELSLEWLTRSPVSCYIVLRDPTRGNRASITRPMRNLRFGLIPCLAAACGASPTPAPVHGTQQPIPVVPAFTSAAKVDMPPRVAAWLHVENPERLASLMDRVSPAEADASCAKGDPRACLALADAHAPVDVAFAPSDSGDDAQASAFSVRSLAAFRGAAEKEFHVTQPRPGRLELGAKAPPPDKKPSSVVCDVSAAEGPAHRVVCGNEPGVAVLGPWLRTSPRPVTNDELARAEIYPGPVVAAAEKQWPGDTLVHRETRQFAHDFGGATLKLTGSDVGAAPVTLDIDVRMQDARSRWTKVLLGPLTAGAAIPETFARLPADTSAAVYMPGGGPLVALLDQLDVLKEVASLDSDEGEAGARRGARGARAPNGLRLPRRPRRRARRAREGAPHAREGPQESGGRPRRGAHGPRRCGVQEPAKAAEQLARNLIQLAPSSGDTYAVRPGASLGLPKGSFLVETTHRKPSKTGTSIRTETTLAVADGSTTWLVFADDAADVRRAVHLSSRLLAGPKGAVSAFPVEPGTVVSAYVTTLFGGFFWTSPLTPSTRSKRRSRSRLRGGSRFPWCSTSRGPAGRCRFACPPTQLPSRRSPCARACWHCRWLSYSLRHPETTRRRSRIRCVT